MIHKFNSILFLNQRMPDSLLVVKQPFAVIPWITIVLSNVRTYP
jgi:hypothetical protein